MMERIRLEITRTAATGDILFVKLQMLVTSLSVSVYAKAILLNFLWLRSVRMVLTKELGLIYQAVALGQVKE